MRKSFLGWMFSCACFGCVQENVGSIDLVKEKVFSIPLKQNVYPKIKQIDNSIVGYFIDGENLTFNSYHLDKNEKFVEFLLDSVKSEISIDIYTQFIWLEPNLLSFFSYNDQKLVLTDTLGEVKQVYSIEEKVQTPPYVGVSFFDRLYTLQDQSLYFNIAYTDFVLESRDDYVEYFNRPMIINVNLKSGAKSEQVEAPMSYREGKFYGDFDIFHCANKKGEVVYSFPSDDSLYVYANGNHQRTVFGGSSFDHEFLSIDIDKQKNLSYQRKHSIQNAMYQKIIYDEYRNQYYRVFKLEQNPVDENGLIKKDKQIAWSLVVLNSDLEIIDEILFENSQYSPAVIEATSDGLIISNYPNDNRDYEFYTLFGVKTG